MRRERAALAAALYGLFHFVLASPCSATRLPTPAVDLLARPAQGVEQAERDIILQRKQTVSARGAVSNARREAALDAEQLRLNGRIPGVGKTSKE